MTGRFRFCRCYRFRSITQTGRSATRREYLFSGTFLRARIVSVENGLLKVNVVYDGFRARTELKVLRDRNIVVW